MTRDQAIDNIGMLIVGARSNQEHLTNAGIGAWARHESELFVKQLETLGLIQFDDSKDWNHLQALAKALSDTVDSGRSLTSARVNAALESYGFKIVRA